MPGKLAFFIPAFLALLSFERKGPGPSLPDIIQKYKRADSLFNLPNADRAALAGFNEVITFLTAIPRNSFNNDILVQCYFKKAIESEVVSDYGGAMASYIRALSFPSGDSLWFKLHVYAGGSYYKLNNFDSANYFLLKAESLLTNHCAPDDKIRLYNTLGALYYDNGNYQQARNYFSQAFEMIRTKKSRDKMPEVSLQINIATSCYRLGLYDASLAIYKQALAYRLFPDQIYMQMGRAYAALNKNEEALNCFRKVKKNVLPAVLNEMAAIKLKERDPDSTRILLNAFSRYASDNNRLDRGMSESIRSDLFIQQGDIPNALKSIQKAIIFFSLHFKDNDVRTNPSSFTGSFAYYGLFDALAKKAAAWEQLYQVTKKPDDLLASLAAYNTTIAFLSYIEKSYNVDDAKILLKQKSAAVYQEALNVCMQLVKWYPDKNFLEQAFEISEKNKASVMSSNITETSFHSNAGKDDSIQQKLRNIKYNIARLNRKADQQSDARSAENIASEKSGYEIELGRLQKSLEKNNRYYELKYNEDQPSIQQLQKRLNGSQALISFFNTARAWHVFIITQTELNYCRLDSVSSLQNNAAQWIRMLKYSESGRKFDGARIGNRLFEQLVKPIQSLIPSKDEWIIVPDGILTLLPFESLPDADHSKTLLETTAVSYQFSSRFLTDANSAREEEGQSADGNLSFAPFANRGVDFRAQGLGEMDPLTASRGEIEGLKGAQFMDSAATKTHFLQHLNDYPVIHLATHAVADINDPSASFIAFYPLIKQPAEDFLFLEELYSLKMDHCKLIIISACETGNGKLIQNEGAISLARAFMYAGCPSTVNSLWKADDKSTSVILKQFHIYLEEGYSKSKALQKAKLDYIENNALNRSPAYWSHLILTGNTSPIGKKKQPLSWAALLIICCSVLSGLIIWFRRKK